jgi:hypothetical protein
MNVTCVVVDKKTGTIRAWYDVGEENVPYIQIPEGHSLIYTDRKPLRNETGIDLKKVKNGRVSDTAFVKEKRNG